MSAAARKTTYTVTGPVAVLGHRPGETFKADLESRHERRLIAAGHLSIGTRRLRPARPKGAQTPAPAEATTKRKERGER